MTLLKKTKKERYNTLAEIESVLLGDNPFFGVDHLSNERARLKAAYSQNFDNIHDVIQYSLQLGAKGMVVSTHPKLKELIEYLRLKSEDMIDKINFFPIIPYTQGYVLKINEKGIVKTLLDIVNPPTSLQNKLKILAKSSLLAIRKDLFELFKFFIDIELLHLSDVNIKAVFLHDVLTDLALSLNLKSLFETFQNHLHDKYSIEAGLITKNFPILAGHLTDWDLKFSTIMTSFNKAGFQMNPSKQSCENCLVNYNGNVIAMSVLAGGYLSAQEAYQYILSQPKIRTVVIGLSSVDHAKNIFEVFVNKKNTF
jgi:hypothetical protein